MRKTILPTRHVVAVATLVTVFGLTLGLRTTVAKESPQNDCLIGLLNEDNEVLTAPVSCTDCDPACDNDDDNSAPNGQCTFSVKACVDLPSGACTAREINRAKVLPPSRRISVTPSGTNSACGAFTDFVIKTKKKGKKPGSGLVTAIASALGKPKAQDRDKIKFTCVPRPAGQSCPTTSTTTTTVTTTSTTTTTTLPTACEGGTPNGTIEGAEECDDNNTVDTDGCTNDCTTCGNGTTTAPETCDDSNLVDNDGCDSNCTITACGNGVVTTGEDCDPAATVTGCGGGETCMPGGTLSECTCKTCTTITPAQALTFTTGTDVATNCGDQGFGGNDAIGTQTGTAVTDDSPTPVSFKLGAGCLYIGGGNSTVPGGLIPDGSQTVLEALQICEGEVVLTPRARTDAASTLSCTSGAGPGKACFNDLTNWPNLTACDDDSDCPLTGSGGTLAAGSCVEKPNCLFGPPLPIANGGLSTCVINSIGTDAGGSVLSATGDARLTMPLRSHTFITGNSDSPCPKCESNLCTYGIRMGLACSNPIGVPGSTIECPPSPDGGAYLPEFQVDLTPLSTGVSTKTASDGLFCPSQQTFSAFGTQSSLGKKVVEITETGVAAGDISVAGTHAVVLGSVFCIPATGNLIIDGAADLPGPGAVSLPGTFQLQ